jgi:hypothetical protein
MKLSKRSEDLIAECRWTAEKLGNDFIDLNHFYLAYSKAVFKDKYDFKLTLTQKKELIKNIKGLKVGGVKNDQFPLTKDFEIALKTSAFHKWILNDKDIDPIHIFLAAAKVGGLGKGTYLQTLADNGIEYGNFRKAMIDVHFNKVLSVFGVEKLISRIF